MKKIKPDDIKKLVIELDLSYEEIYKTLGMSRSWFCKMIMGNPKHSFQNPKPIWMKLVFDYLTAYKAEYVIPNKAFKKKWTNAVKKL